jgi:hypothetical protein
MVPNDPTTTFIVSGDINNGPIAATIGHTGITGAADNGGVAATPLSPVAFTDIFTFTIPQTGVGSGSITTSVNINDFLGVTDLDITSVIVNGLMAFETFRDINGIACPVEGVGTCGAGETFQRNDVPILAGMENTITVSGITRGLGSYGGNLTFFPVQATVPEPATWAMMLIGFGAVGFSLRRKRTTALQQLA